MSRWRRVHPGRHPDGPLPRGDAADNRRLMERIQAPFDASRDRPWPWVERFFDELPRRGWLLDLAAGNGRHASAAARAGHRVVAVDVSRAMLKRLRAGGAGPGPGVQRVEADALSLPLGDGAVTNALYPAGLHCIRGRAQRVRSLAELRRVLHVAAEVLVTVWWRDPQRFGGPLGRTDRILRESQAVQDDGAPAVEPGDVSLPWRYGLVQPVDRFFHLYEEDELVADLEAGGFAQVDVERHRFGSTWNLVARART